jgi:outer membrane lipoprotein-sorting protein
MIKGLSLPFIFSLHLLLHLSPVLASEPSKENRVLAVAEKMEVAFKEVRDYTCEVEQIFYKDGVEGQRYRFKFYFKREKKIRVDFSSPYPELTLLYRGNSEEITILPFRFFSLLKLHYSIEGPRVQTPAGQRINQTDMGYFIDFLLRNLRAVEQKEDDYHEEGDSIRFLLWGLDYIGGKIPEKYRITLSKRNWLPVRIERYASDGKPLEVTIIQDYAINTHLEDKLFVP